MMFELVVLILLIVLSAFFSCSEIALFSLSPTKIQALVKNNVKGAFKVQKLRAEPKKLLITILVGNNVVNISAAALTTVLAIKLIGNSAVSIAAGILTLIILIFGEICPKAVGQKHAAWIALHVGGILNFLIFLLTPIVWALDKTTNFVNKIGSTAKATVTEDEIKAIVEVSAAEGTIEHHEKEMIERVLKFTDLTAKDIITPRMSMVCMEGTQKLSDALTALVDCPYTRIPLYHKTKDKIVGILNVKDILYYLEKKQFNITLKDISKKPLFVPENKPIYSLFKEFKEKHLHMAVVVDEFGGTMGIATMEDVLEEIMGSISDDKDKDKEPIERIDKHTIRVAGNASLDDINNFFNLKIPGKGTEVINSFILKKLKRIPRKGEQINLDTFTLTIDKASGRRIKKVIISKNVTS